LFANMHVLFSASCSAVPQVMLQVLLRIHIAYCKLQLA